MSIKCSSCKKNLISEEKFSKFKCPECGEEEIIRCKECRLKGTEYECKCGFTGP